MVFTYLSYLNFCDWKSSLFISHLATITKRSYVVSIFLSVQLLVLKQLPMQTFCLSSLFPAFRCYAKGEKAELEHVDEWGGGGQKGEVAAFVAIYLHD